MFKRTFFKMAGFAGALLFCSSLILPAANAQSQSDPQRITVSGVVTCTMCMVPGLCQNQTRFSCTQWWISQGANYVIVAGNQHYILAGMEGDLAEASTKSSVTVTGELISISRITERFRLSSLLDLLRPTTELSVVSITWPHKKHADKHQLAPAAPQSPVSHSRLRPSPVRNPVVVV